MFCPPLRILMLLGIFLYFSLKCLRPDSVPVMPFVDSRWSAWGIFRLFSSVELAATYYMGGNGEVRVCSRSHDFDSSLSKSNMSYEPGASSCSRRWGAWRVHLIPKQTEADILNIFSTFPHQRLFAEGRLCLRPLLCGCTLWWQFCWLFLNWCEMLLGAVLFFGVH